LSPDRTLPWDWHKGRVPENAIIDDTAYLETTFSFESYRSLANAGLIMARGSSAYRSTMFDVGMNGKVRLGEFALVNGARIVCDDAVEIGDHCLISWNVMVMDTYRWPLDVRARRQSLRTVARSTPRCIPSLMAPQPVKIGNNVWIGFDCCILPGTLIGEGAIIGAGSVVAGTIPPFAVAVGNPARTVRILERP